jgi:hypothetical protein
VKDDYTRDEHCRWDLKSNMDCDGDMMLVECIQNVMMV